MPNIEKKEESKLFTYVNVGGGKLGLPIVSVYVDVDEDEKLLD